MDTSERGSRRSRKAPTQKGRPRSTLEKVTIRVPTATQEVLKNVYAHLPELYESISEVQREAVILGALVLAAGSVAPDRPGQWGGLPSDLLASLLARQLGSALKLLANQGYLPVIAGFGEKGALPEESGLAAALLQGIAPPTIDALIAPDDVEDIDFFGRDILDEE